MSTTPRVPMDLRKVLASSAKTKALWTNLTPIAHRDFISWIESAKQAETRKRRVDSIPSRLATGKRRPCCYAVVPMNFYKALATVPKAKTVWKNLNSHEKRDYVSWVESPKESADRALRANKACTMLASGKRHP